jgi:hypothetical protein
MRNLKLATAPVLVVALGMFGLPAHAGEAGAFIGGIFATKIMDNMQRRTRAEEVQAYEAARAPAPSSGSSSQSAESRLRELDKLAAGGYITPQEYKAKKQAIIDSM